MRGRSSSSKQISRKVVGVSMEKHKVDKVKQEPHLSGAYIRTLVKHLTRTTKDSLDANQTLTTNGDHNNMESPPPPPPPPAEHKKQVRRRQHTTRPYQERLLNMAEARREIVTALKFHRASKKQQQSVANNNYSSLSSPPAVPYYCPTPTLSPPPLPPPYQENLDFSLPNLPLGLNLNFQDFKNLDVNFYHNPLSTSSASSSSSTSTSSSAAISAASNGGDLHHAMDDDEIEKIRCLGEQHEIEWNDKVNLVMSARWFKFLKTMEVGSDDRADDYNNEFNPFDQVMEFPPWLINANESQQHYIDHHFSDELFQDPALPCMDIGEIEGMDGEWLA